MAHAECGPRQQSVRSDGALRVLYVDLEGGHCWIERPDPFQEADLKTVMSSCPVV